MKVFDELGTEIVIHAFNATERPGGSNSTGTNGASNQ
jgi:hypothetical protein